ncbi:MEKHLA domain-containing protein [Saccharopolyspora sp. 5N708]|uniref:MEKHLA domain-containing protein n=1 Tax=Saccharopolyspora sp. 5N708 TaxID=3457424 RepID=UPI003FD61135
MSSGDSRALDPAFADLLRGSYHRVVGEPLVPESREPASWLYYDAPFGLLAHDAAADPVFTYANRISQTCFEYSWAEFTELPSRLSAEPDRQEDRDQLIAAVHEHGYAEGYRGIRIAKSGRRFWIQDVTMWNLIDSNGIQHGQAALFRRWRDA